MTKTLPKTYKTTNWSEYNQSLRNRGSLTIWLHAGMQWQADATGKKGRSPTFSDAAIQFALTMKNLFKLALRQTEGFLQSLFKLSGIDWCVPDFSTISRRAASLQPTICKSARTAGQELHVLVDSTGIKLSGDGEWVRKQHGVQQRRQWLKLHLAIDGNTGEIQAVEVTTCQYGDAQMLPHLLNQIDDDISSVTTDGAYDSREVYQAILARGAKVIIPPRSNAVHWAEDAVGQCRNRAVASCQADSKQWKQAQNYHRRSLIESKMFAFKRLGDGVSSRCFDRQVVDLQIRVAIMNCFTGLGIAKTLAVA